MDKEGRAYLPVNILRRGFDVAGFAVDAARWVGR